MLLWGSHLTPLTLEIFERTKWDHMPECLARTRCSASSTQCVNGVLDKKHCSDFAFVHRESRSFTLRFIRQCKTHKYKILKYNASFKHKVNQDPWVTQGKNSHLIYFWKNSVIFPLLLLLLWKVKFLDLYTWHFLFFTFCTGKPAFDSSFTNIIYIYNTNFLNTSFI